MLRQDTRKLAWFLLWRRSCFSRVSTLVVNVIKKGHNWARSRILVVYCICTFFIDVLVALCNEMQMKNFPLYLSFVPFYSYSFFKHSLWTYKSFRVTTIIKDYKIWALKWRPFNPSVEPLKHRIFIILWVDQGTRTVTHFLYLHLTVYKKYWHRSRKQNVLHTAFSIYT